MHIESFCLAGPWAAGWTGLAENGSGKTICSREGKIIDKFQNIKSNNQELASPDTVEVDDDGVVQSRYTGYMTRIILGISLIWTLFQLYMNTFGVMDAVKFRSWHLFFLLILTFILYPAGKKQRGIRKHVSLWDFICILLTIVSLGYFALTYDDFIRERSGVNITADYWFGGIGILLLFEATRRIAGKGLTIIAALFLFYNFIGAYIPGMFGHNGFSIERVINVMFWGGQGIFGTALGVSATYIFVFVLFGAFLKNSGFTEFINDLALTLAGRTSGGPAKVAVIGSGLMGMVSGSAVSNVVTTGTVTIPLMKKTGYTPRFAAAVESVASTGGLIAPPVMGAAAFIMAEYLGVSYTVVMTAAIVPALLYYTTVFMAVHFEAKRLGLSGISKENIPDAVKVLKEGGHLLIPLIVLLGVLFSGVTPLFAAIWALLATVFASYLRKSTRMSLKTILKSIEEGAKGVLTVGIACAIVGIVVGTISLTSLGLTIGNNVMSIAGESIFLAAILTMLISIILGMGVPATAAYIIVTTVSVPILTNMGVPALAAHMFAFYYSALSGITPPVALASYAAAGIAGTNPNKVSLESVKLGLIAFILPFFFLYNPALIFQDVPVWEGILGGMTAIAGGVAFASVLKGWLLYKLNIWQRVLLLVAAYLLIEPTLLNDIAGIGLIAAVTAVQYIKKDGEISPLVEKETV